MSKIIPDCEMRSRYRKMRVDGKQVSVHRYIMEQILGRPLKRNEQVHHINGDRYDNRPENLQLVSPKEHRMLHPQVFSEETRKKISLSLLGHKRNFGKVHTAEHNSKISASLIGNQRRKGYIYTDEEKKRISDSMRAARKKKFWSTRKK